MSVLDRLYKSIRDPYMVNAMKRTPAVTEDTTWSYTAGKYSVYVTNSCYVTDLIVTVKGYWQPVYLEFLDETTVHLGFRTNLAQWERKVLKERFCENLFDGVAEALKTGKFIGGSIHTRPFKHFAVWDFNSYNMITKG